MLDKIILSDYINWGKYYEIGKFIAVKIYLRWSFSKFQSNRILYNKHYFLN